MFDFNFDIFGVAGTGQLIFNGLVTGMVFGLLAMGIVLVYRSTRVINFAVGNMGIPASALLAVMVINFGFPYWIAFAIALVIGTLLGAIIELTVIRRLFKAPRIILVVATIGIAQLMQAIVASYPDVENEGRPRYPVPAGAEYDDLLGLRATSPQLTILVVVPLLALALGWLMTRTLYGKAVRASAVNPDLARTTGISPKLISTSVWTIAGLLATVSAILLSGQQGSIAGFASLGPNTLARALAAAVLAGMVSFPRALLAGMGVGVIQALVQFNFLDTAGLFDFLLFVAVAIAVFIQARNHDERATFSFAPKTRPLPDALASSWWAKNLHKPALALMLVAAVVLPILSDKPSRHLVYATIVVYAICAVSVTVVSGWSGQLSLGQMAFAGLGAFAAAAFNRAGVPFGLSLPLGAIVAGLTAALVGAGALRVRGLFLAVTTFVFGLAANQFLFRVDLLSDGESSSVGFRRGTLFGWSLDNERNYYWFVLAILVVVLAIVARLRGSGIGRSIIAVRDNAASAASYTVKPMPTRLTAFGLSGAIAGLGGAALGGLLQQVPLNDRFFQPFESLRIVSMAVMGGIGTVFGPVLGAFWSEGLRGLFPDNELVPLFTSSLGLLLLLMYLPGGLMQIAYSLREWIWSVAERRAGEVDTSRTTVAPASIRAEPTEDREPATLAVRDVSVRFGGVAAVSHVSLDIGDGEIVGLIGTNGAGKSTLMNAIGGYVNSTGHVELLGRDVSSQTPSERARLGLGRTFQAATLFPELTVRETVQVALEARGRTGLVSTALHSPLAARRERARASEADELIGFLGLGRYANSSISELSTGTRRIVELAGLFAVNARVLCLDEPTAGVAQRESEAFGDLLVGVRKELDASILIIEHDMPMIMSVSDRVYCLELGQVIAEGSPDEVRNDPLVVSSYLGTDERAIARSDN